MGDHAVLSRDITVRISYRLLYTHISMDRIFGYEPDDECSNHSGCTVVSFNGRKLI